MVKEEAANFTANLSFRNEGDIDFSRQKLRKFITTRPALQEMVKEVFKLK